jgi:YD repeat-containing protein
MKHEADRNFEISVYDDATGLLVSKIYADGAGPSYTYTPDGRLATRTWARGIVTAYGYDSAKRLSSISYSAGAAPVSFSYDRLGRPTSATVAGDSENLYHYSALGLLTNELQNGVEIRRSYDTLGRAAGYWLPAPGFAASPSAEVAYDYDEYGRFAAVSASQPGAPDALSFGYGYLPGSDLIQSMTASTGHARAIEYEDFRNLVAW